MPNWVSAIGKSFRRIAKRNRGIHFEGTKNRGIHFEGTKSKQLAPWKYNCDFELF
jgi:hypothetical protein